MTLPLYDTLTLTALFALVLGVIVAAWLAPWFA